MIRNECRISIDSDILRKFPELKKLEKTINVIEIQRYLKMFNSRDELTAKMTTEGMRVSFRSIHDRENKNRYDDLGLIILDKKLRDICNVYREESGHDPSRWIVTTKKSSPYSVDILDKMKNKNTHPLDTVFDEEVVDRRQKFNEKHAPKRKR